MENKEELVKPEDACPVGETWDPVAQRCVLDIGNPPPVKDEIAD